MELSILAFYRRWAHHPNWRSHPQAWQAFLLLTSEMQPMQHAAIMVQCTGATSGQSDGQLCWFRPPDGPSVNAFLSVHAQSHV